MTISSGTCEAVMLSTFETGQMDSCIRSPAYFSVYYQERQFLCVPGDDIAAFLNLKESTFLIFKTIRNNKTSVVAVA